MRNAHYLFVLIALAVAGCAPPGGGQGANPTGQSSAANRRLVIISPLDVEFAASPLAAGTSSRISRAGIFFRAGLSVTDQNEAESATVWPQLAEALPQLDTGTWKVFPDGRMETTWTLRPGLTWHDGAPLTAGDFVLGWQIVKTPEFAPSTDLKRVDEVTAPDPRTVVIKWNSPYKTADQPNPIKSGTDSSNGVRLDPVPRHILGDAFAQQAPEQFAANPYFGDNNAYVGAGPYKVDHYEPGAFMEGSAFDNYALGRPHIDRIRVLIVPDKNTALANLLAGEAHMSFEQTLLFEQGVVLKREWANNSGGTVRMLTDTIRFTAVEMREQWADPADILDVRVRQALDHAIDKQAFVDGIMEGEGNPAETVVAPTVPYYDQIDRVIQKYPFDPNRAHQLLTEAGLTRGPNGIYLTKSGARFSPQLRSTSGYDRESAILADAWRRIGVDVQERYSSVAEDSNGEFRSTFPAFATTYNSSVGINYFTRVITANVASADNRYSGVNRGGYSSPEFDRFADVALNSLRLNERIAAGVQGVRVLNRDLPVLPLYHSAQQADAWSATLEPPPATNPASRLGAWNIHAWKWRS